MKLCQQRLLACEPPFENRHRYDGNFRLIEYRAPASTSTPQADIGQLTVKEANKLATRGTCTWTCLLAIEEICTCRCGGPYHGAAVEALRDLRATIAAPAA